MLLGCVAACAQEPTTLPEAPQAVVGPHPHGMVVGVVKDVGGTTVPGAHVSLITKGAEEMKATTDAEGKFFFPDVLTGNFGVVVSEEGLKPASAAGNLKAGERLELPPVVMQVAMASDSIEVTYTREEIAEAEIKQQEKQRVGGVVPNFFVSYNWNAQPLTAKQKFELGWHSTLDPTHFIFAAISAGIEQANNDYPGFGCCWSGYGQRYGAAMADSTTGTFIRGSIMPAIFHQDPRYFYKGTGSYWSRGWYAVSTSVRSRSDKGHWEVSSGILADFASGALSNLYYAPSDRHGAGLTLENGALGTVGVAVGHLIQEFVFKHLTPGVIDVPPVPAAQQEVIK